MLRAKQNIMEDGTMLPENGVVAMTYWQKIAKRIHIAFEYHALITKEEFTEKFRENYRKNLRQSTTIHAMVGSQSRISRSKSAIEIKENDDLKSDIIKINRFNAEVIERFVFIGMAAVIG